MDLDNYRNKIVAVIHNDTVSEAFNIFSLLPVFLETHLRGQIWQWFSIECGANMSSYTLDEYE